MNDVSKITGNNLGGLASIVFCPVDLVNSIPDPVQGSVLSSVIFQAGGRWFSFGHTFETLSFSQNKADSEQGKHYEQVISGFLPNQSADLDWMFMEMEEKKHFLKVTDTNGHIFIIGRMEAGEKYGAAFSVEYNSQSKISGLKGYSFKFVLLSPERALYYNISGSGSGS